MSTRVSDLTADELNTLIESAIDRKLAEWLGDPDEGLELTPELLDRITRQRKAFAAGQHGRSLDDLRQNLQRD